MSREIQKFRRKLQRQVQTGNTPAAIDSMRIVNMAAQQDEIRHLRRELRRHQWAMLLMLIGILIAAWV